MSKLTKEQIEYGIKNLGMSKLTDAYQGEASDENGFTDIFYKVVHGVDISNCSKKDLDIINTRGFHLLHVAAAFNNVEAINTIIEQGITVDILTPWQSTALMFAAETGAKDAIKFLIKKSAKIDAIKDNNNQAIHIAALNGKIEAVKALIELKPDLIEAKGNHDSTPLMFAAQFGHADVIRWLYKTGAKIDAVNKYGNQAIHIAVFNGKIEAVKALIELKLDLIEAQGNGNCTPLMWAAQEGHVDVIELLCSKKAKIDVVNKYGNQAIHVAALNGKAEAVKALLDCGADINAMGNGDYTPLMCAAQKGHVDVIKFLLSKGAKIDAIDENGNQAIHIAVLNDQLKVVKFLLPELSKNNKLKNALESRNFQIFKDAISKGYYTIAAILYEKLENEAIQNIMLASCKQHTANIDKFKSMINFKKKGHSLTIIASVCEEMFNKKDKGLMEAGAFLTESKKMIDKLESNRREDAIITYNVVIKSGLLSSTAKKINIPGFNGDIINSLVERITDCPGINYVKALGITFENIIAADNLKPDAPEIVINEKQALVSIAK